MKHVANLSAAVLVLTAMPAYSAGSDQAGFLQIHSIAAAEVVDSARTVVGLWFPDVLGDDEYLIHTIGSITFIAEVRDNGIKGDPDANLYYASDCSGSPFIEEVTGPSFYQDRLTIPYQETFSGIDQETGAGTSPLYYADTTSGYTTTTACAYQGPDQVCSPIPGCESINAYPALTWDWSGYVQPFLFK
jgi:hypothetical protein